MRNKGDLRGVGGRGESSCERRNDKKIYTNVRKGNWCKIMTIIERNTKRRDNEPSKGFSGDENFTRGEAGRNRI